MWKAGTENFYEIKKRNYNKAIINTRFRAPPPLPCTGNDIGPDGATALAEARPLLRGCLAQGEVVGGQTRFLPLLTFFSFRKFWFFPPILFFLSFLNHFSIFYLNCFQLHILLFWVFSRHKLQNFRTRIFWIPLQQEFAHPGAPQLTTNVFLFFKALFF